jgi:hypothetical protein
MALRALELDPSHIIARWGGAYTLALLGQVEEAR